MRWRAVCAVGLTPLLLISCKQEQDFDERYQQQSLNIQAAANSLEQEMENRIAASNRIEAARRDQERR